MTTLYLDLETYCEVPITHGTHRYAEEAEILLVALAVDDAPVDVWDCAQVPFDPRERLQSLIDAADTVVIHNSHFDRTVLRHCGVNIPVEKIRDTMVQALAHSLPGSLGTLCDVLGVPTDKAKDKAGKKLIHLFTKPRPKNMKLRRADSVSHPTEWNEFIEYARLDVDAMRDVYGRLPNWNNSRSERNLWRIDQGVNDRGIAIDLELAHAALRAFRRTSGTLAARAANLTGGHVTKLTQGARFLQYLRDYHNFAPENLTKSTVAELLRGNGLTPIVRELLEIRQQAAATSPAKYKVLLDATSSDGRLRGTLQFCGASRTGRDAGRIFQPQNLPRPTMDADEIETGISAMKLDCEDLLFDNVTDLCSSAVRGCLVAPEGRKLVIADLSNIEGRVLAWLAGEDWKVEAFYDFDRGVGHDLYVVAYAKGFNVDPEVVVDNKKNGDGSMRQYGKTMELACLGPDTRVLTNSGVKAITKVTTDDLLWDGEEWVTHEGLINRGEKETIWLGGLELTPDHEVLVGQTWQQAQTVVSCQNTRDHALVTGMANLPWSAWNSDLWAAYGRLKWRVLVGQPLTQYLQQTSGAEPALDATLAPKKPADSGSKIGFGTKTYAPTTNIADVCATEYPRASIGATTQTTEHTSITGVVASMFTNLGAKIEEPFLLILSRSTAGMSQNLNLTELITTGVMSRTISVSSENEPIVTTCGASEIYKSASSNLRPVYDIANAGPRNRFTVICDSGALIVHNCGYQGGIGAFRTMGGPAVAAMTDEEIQPLVTAWRNSHANVVKLWYGVEAAAKAVIRKPEDVTFYDKLQFDMKDGWLRIKLPSGRYLSYRNAKIEDGRITFEGMNQYTRKWERLETYGGKLVENITQAVARDVFMTGMVGAEGHGYEVCIRVHDELITETPDTPEYTVAELASIMATNPSWAVGLPLAAAGFETHRYKKD